MNILILGNNSFIGKSIIPELSKNYSIYSTSRADLDLTSYTSTREYIKKIKPDIIINTVFDGGSYKENTEKTYYNNIDMLRNLQHCRDLYSKLIIFGSGLEFSRPIDISKEIKSYFDAKITCARIAYNDEQIIKLNLFNVFGPLENSRRFVKNCIDNCKNGRDIIIENDRYFDLFYIGDLIRVIKHLINNPPESYYEMDVCYSDKLKLSETAQMIKELTKSDVSVNINSESYRNYIGNAEKLNELKLFLGGLRQGLENYING